MASLKFFAEIVVSLSVVGAWFYVALTLPDPALAASAGSAPSAPAQAQSASRNLDIAKGQLNTLIVQR